MPAKAGKKALVKIAGAAVAFTDEATTSAGDDRTYQITSTTKRVWDPTTSITVEEAGVTTVESYTYDRLTGTIVFASADAFRGVVTITGFYLPLSTAAECKSYSYAISTTNAPDNAFGDSWVTRVQTLLDITGSLGKWWIDSYFASALLADTQVVLEFYSDSSTDADLICWARISRVGIQSAISGLVDESVDFEGTVDAAGTSSFFIADTSAGPPMTSALLLTEMAALGHDVLGIFMAADLADGATTGASWTPRYRKSGLTTSDVPNMTLAGNPTHCNKVYRSGQPVVRYDATQGWISSANSGASYDLSLGLTIYYIGTAQASGAPFGLQNGVAGATPARYAAMYTDTNLQGRAHPQIALRDDSGANLTRYHTRCTLDARLRLFSMAILPKVGGEPGCRASIQRSADHAIEDHREFVNGRGNIGLNASNCTYSAGGNYLHCGIIQGVQSASEDVAAIVICRTPQTGSSARLVQQFAKDSCTGYEETAKRVVFIGDSLGHGISTGRDPVTPFESYTAATDDGGNAALQTTLQGIVPGVILSNACWGGETAWSLKTLRESFILPLWLNATSREEVICVLVGYANDVSPNAEYGEPGANSVISTNVQDVIAFIRALPNSNRIKIIATNTAPCWVDGATNPADVTEVKRVAVNGLLNAALPALVDAYRDTASNHTYGDPGDNTNTTYYQVDLTHMTEAGYGLRRTEAATDVGTVA